MNFKKTEGHMENVTFLFVGEKRRIKTKSLVVSDDPSYVLEPHHGNVDENFDPIQDEMELGMVEMLNKTIEKGDLRAKLKSKESKNEKVDPKMDHFDDFQEKDGYESTKPLDVLPNKPRSDDFGDNQTQDEINFGELQEKLDLSKNDETNITRRECVSIGSGKIQEDKTPVMNKTSKLTGRNVFLNMPHSYDFRDKNIVGKGVFELYLFKSNRFK